MNGDNFIDMLRKQTTSDLYRIRQQSKPENKIQPRFGIKYLKECSKINY